MIGPELNIQQTVGRRKRKEGRGEKKERRGEKRGEGKENKRKGIENHYGNKNLPLNIQLTPFLFLFCFNFH